MSEITSAELVKYNANSSNNSVGDCVKRALSLAFDMSYQEISKALLAKMKAMHQYAWNIPPVYVPVIKEHGGSGRIHVPEDNIQIVSEFADSHPTGTWLVETSDKPNSTTNHILCIIDGKVFDSWNSLSKYVRNYYIVEGTARKEFTSIDIRDFIDYIGEYQTEVGTALLKKYDWGEFVTFWDSSYATKKNNKYNVTVKHVLKVGPRPYYDRGSTYDFKYGITLTPTTTEDEARKFIQSTIKQRMYNRLYSINQEEKKKQEAAEFSGGQSLTSRNLRLYTSAEHKFYKSLPGWAQGLLTYVNIQYPGKYSDSYTIYIKPLPNDNGENYIDRDGEIRIEGYTADDIRNVLDHYKKTGYVLHPYEM